MNGVPNDLRRCLRVDRCSTRRQPASVVRQSVLENSSSRAPAAIRISNAANLGGSSGAVAKSSLAISPTDQGFRREPRQAPAPINANARPSTQPQKNLYSRFAPRSWPHRESGQERIMCCRQLFNRPETADHRFEANDSPGRVTRSATVTCALFYFDPAAVSSQWRRSQPHAASRFG